MSKEKTQRRLASNEAKAGISTLKTSPQKLNLICKMIRGMHVSDALNALKACKKRASLDVTNVLSSAIANAENNHGLDVDSLIVAEAYVGKAFMLKRHRPRARGRAGKILKTYSNMTVLVREVEVA